MLDKKWRNDERCFLTKEAATNFAKFARPHSKFSWLDRSKNYRIRKVGRHWRIQDYL